MESRRLVVGLVGINILLAAALAFQGRTSAAADPGVLRARAIELVDADGRVRGQLNVESSGEAVFRLRGPDGAIRVKLGASADGAGLLLLDGATEPGIHLLAKSGGSSVTLAIKGGPRRVITP